MTFRYSVEQIETIYGPRWAIMRADGSEFDRFQSEQEAREAAARRHILLK